MKGKCKGCKMKRLRAELVQLGFASNCGGFKPRTNGDRIRSLPDEELAYWAANGCPSIESKETCNYFDDCSECWLDWLKKEADE